MHPNEQLIQTFYTGFQNRDAAGMAACRKASSLPSCRYAQPVAPARQTEIGAAVITGVVVARSMLRHLSQRAGDEADTTRDERQNQECVEQ